MAMSWLTQQINSQSRGVIRVPVNDEGVPHVIDEPVTVRCAVEVEAGAEIQVSQPITLKNGASWLGAGGRHKLSKSGSAPLFTIAGSEQAIGNFNTDETASTGGFTFYIDNAQSREHIRIAGVRTYKGRGLIADSNQPGIIVNMHVDDVMARAHRGRGSYLQKAFAYISFRRCTVDYVGENTNIPAWVFLNTEGIELDYVDVTGTAINGNVPLQYGFYFENVRALTIKQAMADNVGGFGFYFKNCNWIDAAILKSSMCGDVGLLVAGGTKNIRVGNLYLSGRSGLPNDQAAALIWADETSSNIHACQAIFERFSNAYGGVAQYKFTAGRLVTG